MGPNLSFFFFFFLPLSKCHTLFESREHGLRFSYSLTSGHATRLGLPVSAARGRGSVVSRVMFLRQAPCLRKPPFPASLARPSRWSRGARFSEHSLRSVLPQPPDSVLPDRTLRSWDAAGRDGARVALRSEGGGRALAPPRNVSSRLCPTLSF